MLKKIVDGKVSVLISRGYGAGWYSWNTKFPQSLFHPDLVELVEEKYILDKEYLPYTERSNPNNELNIKKKEIISKIETLATSLFGDDFYHGGAEGLYIQQVYEGESFVIKDFDGQESLRYVDELGHYMIDDYIIITA
jgi:hypothetical protein